MTRSRLTPRPTTPPFAELMLLGVASVAIGLGACGHSQHLAPTCGPCCHGGHGAQCQPAGPRESEPDASVTAGDASAAEASADASVDVNTGADEHAVATDAGARATRDAGPVIQVREYIPNPAPTCGPRCHNGGGDGPFVPIPTPR